MEWKEKIRHWCARGERSTFETKAKLSRLGASPQEAAEFVVVLEKEGFLNEERYVQAFIHDHFKLKNWGPRKLHHGLKKKGCAAHLIEQELSKLTPEDLENALNQTIETRFTLYPEEHKTHRERLIRYLQNRGYTLDNILSALSRL
jgi:SOS response regulatory protein OraA/RecX